MGRGSGVEILVELQTINEAADNSKIAPMSMRQSHPLMMEAANASHYLSSASSDINQFNALWVAKDPMFAMTAAKRQGYLNFLQTTFGFASLERWEADLRSKIFGGYSVLKYPNESCFQVIYFCSRLLTF